MTILSKILKILIVILILIIVTRHSYKFGYKKGISDTQITINRNQLIKQTKDLRYLVLTYKNLYESCSGDVTIQDNLKKELESLERENL